MKTERALRTRLSRDIAFVALLTVALISVLSNVFIKRRFEGYVTQRQSQRIEAILADLGQQYDAASDSWDLEALHAIGMHALYDGYIVKLYGPEKEMLWDAEVHDMTTCARIMEDISQKMRTRRAAASGSFTVKNHGLVRDGRTIAVAGIGYFSPYFYSDDDFRFLDSLNAVLAGSGVFSLLLAVGAGWLLSRRLSAPIREAAEIAKRLSGGDYAAGPGAKTGIIELDELQEAVGRLALSLDNQERLRKRLTADVAHELRTPLTNVATHIEAMVEGIWEPTRERLSGCGEEIARIAQLVRGLESLARVESDNLKLDKARIDLSELVEKTLASFEAETAAKKLAVSVEGSCSEIWADPDRIRQVLTNLLSNAVKYTPPGGAVRVSLSETENAALLAVEDNGTGISQEDLPFVFERFYRADKSRNRLSGGSGIGLAVVRSIVEAHGGKAEAESRVGEGSRFLVTLPMDEKRF